MIIVTGANGKLGRRVVERLLERVPAGQVGVSVRDPGAARDLAERGVRVRPGDFADPASLERSLEGASRVLVVSVDRLGEEALAQHRVAVGAAAKAGAERIVYTSHQGTDPASRFAATRDHAATEQLLRESGVPYTALRNGFYAATVPQLIGPARQTGEIALPADGPVSWTTHDDLAEAVDFDRVAAILSGLTGRTITRVTLSDEDYRARMVGHGVPAPAVDLLLDIFAASRAGEFAAVDPALGARLGRTPTSVEAYLRAEPVSAA